MGVGSPFHKVSLLFDKNFSVLRQYLTFIAIRNNLPFCNLLQSRSCKKFTRKTVVLSIGSTIAYFSHITECKGELISNKQTYSSSENITNQKYFIIKQSFDHYAS